MHIKIIFTFEIASYYGFQYQWTRWPEKIDEQGNVAIQGIQLDSMIGQCGSIPIDIEQIDSIWHARVPSKAAAPAPATLL